MYTLRTSAFPYSEKSKKSENTQKYFENQNQHKTHFSFCLRRIWVIFVYLRRYWKDINIQVLHDRCFFKYRTLSDPPGDFSMLAVQELGIRGMFIPFTEVSYISFFLYN